MYHLAANVCFHWVEKWDIKLHLSRQRAVWHLRWILLHPRSTKSVRTEHTVCHQQQTMLHTNDWVHVSLLTWTSIKMRSFFAVIHQRRQRSILDYVRTYCRWPQWKVLACAVAHQTTQWTIEHKAKVMTSKKKRKQRAPLLHRVLSSCFFLPDHASGFQVPDEGEVFRAGKFALSSQHFDDLADAC